MSSRFRGFLKTYRKALRFHYTPCSTLPAALGSMIAVQASAFNIWYFILLMVSIIANHLAVNMTDDYFDFLHGADVHQDENFNAYAGGSGVLTAKEMSPEFMKNSFVILYILASCIGLYFVIMRGWVILALGAIGVFSSYFYTAPPIRFSYRGWGELAILVNLGPIITIGAYYLQNSTISVEVIIAGFTLGFLVFAQILCNEIPDYETDKLAGKKTLVVLFGKEVGLYLAMIAKFICFVIVLAGILKGHAPIWSLLVFLVIPLLYRAFSSLRKTLHQKKIQGNFEMVKAHVFVGILLILGYAIQAVQNGKNILHISFVLLCLGIVMIPVFLKFYEPQSE